MMQRGADAGGRLIVLDAGNTRLSIALLSGPDQVPGPGAVGPERRVDLPDLRLLEEVPVPGRMGEPGRWRDFAAAVAGVLGRWTQLPAVLVSVVPEATAALQAKFPAMAVVAHTWKLPFVLDVDRPEAVGPDRLANVAAAAAAGLAEALVVDAGTATTFDLLRAGRFTGGLIAPGMGLAAAALGAGTARLPAVPLAACPLEVGRDTAAAMGAGAWHVGRLGILGTVAGLLDRYGDRAVVFTGGLGGAVAAGDRPYDRFWTLRGAAILYILNFQPDIWD